VSRIAHEISRLKLFLKNCGELRARNNARYSNRATAARGVAPKSFISMFDDGFRDSLHSGEEGAGERERERFVLACARAFLSSRYFIFSLPLPALPPSREQTLLLVINGERDPGISMIAGFFRDRSVQQEYPVSMVSMMLPRRFHGNLDRGRIAMWRDTTDEMDRSQKGNLI